MNIKTPMWEGLSRLGFNEFIDLQKFPPTVGLLHLYIDLQEI